ncbi:MAG TPA: serine--tRNA ligase [Gemmatimonadaceae bacterium]|nr:serine--tRNA ligase [Gemmatimonadaceae bacterium]
MIDARMVREQAGALREGVRRRGSLDAHGPVIDRAERLDRERRATIQAVEERKAARNAASQEVARKKKAGENADELMASARAIGAEIARLEAELEASQGAFDTILMELPNVTLPEVPEGDASANVVVSTWGDPRAAGSVKPHWEVAEALGLLDLPRGAKISGSGFIVYRARGAKLQRALMNFLVDLHTREFGYEETQVPLFVNRASMTGTGQFPKFEDDSYALRDDALFAIPTSEVPVTNLFRDEILDGASLPLALTAFSQCFRREAGAAGKDTRGLLRLHQFDKVELVRFTAPEDSPAQLELLTSHAEQALQRLGLPHRRLLLAAGDTGFSNAKTYDLETFAPGVGSWLEVSSCSSYTDFQARRANIRYRPAPGEKPRHVHTLNGSGLGFPRVIATILEHYQNADGSVTVPEVLRPYFGADVIR